MRILAVPAIVALLLCSCSEQTETRDSHEEGFRLHEMFDQASPILYEYQPDEFSYDPDSNRWLIHDDGVFGGSPEAVRQSTFLPGQEKYYGLMRCLRGATLTPWPNAVFFAGTSDARKSPGGRLSLLSQEKQGQGTVKVYLGRPHLVLVVDAEGNEAYYLASVDIHDILILAR